MLHAFLVVATEAGEEATSKAPFYAMGLLLALWAVAISAVGISRAATFPPSLGGRNGVILFSALLVLGATGSAVLTA
jgi:hypothetical protein